MAAVGTPPGKVEVTYDPVEPISPSGPSGQPKASVSTKTRLASTMSVWTLGETESPHMGGEGVLLMNAAPDGYWFLTFFAYKGRAISGRILAMAFVYFSGTTSFLMLAPKSWDLGTHIDTTTLAMTGTALSFLLVFRTQGAYDRWWEGRKHWGMVINRTRDFARQSAAYINDVHHVEKLIRYTIAFAVVMKRHLRFERNVSELQTMDVLTPNEIDEILSAKHMPNFVLDVMSQTVASAKNTGLIDSYTAMTLDGNLTQFHDELGACERILKTKMPFAYIVHMRAFLVFWVVCLPFALVPKLEWATILACCAIAYSLLGLDSIGVEIENPFGHDFNDLPLDDITDNTIQKNLMEILNRQRSNLTRIMVQSCNVQVDDAAK